MTFQFSRVNFFCFWRKQQVTQFVFLFFFVQMKTWKAAINVQVFVTNVKLRKIKFLLRIRTRTCSCAAGCLQKPVNYSELAGRKLKVHTCLWRKRIFKYAYVIPWRKKESRSREEQYPTSHASFICHQGSLNCWDQQFCGGVSERDDEFRASWWSREVSV